VLDCEGKRTSIHLARGITPNGKERRKKASSSPASLDHFSDRLNRNGDNHLSDWELVDSGTNGTGQDESVYFTANRAGKYYIKVYSYSGRGNYTLRIKRRY